MFSNKVVWITGASSGIGLAFAEALHASGAKLILSALTPEELEPVIDKLPGAKSLAFNVADFDALPGLVKEAHALFGSIDVLVNNAGITTRALAKDTTFNVYRKVIDIDLMAPIALTQLVTPYMRAQGSGRIIAMSSITGKFGVPMRSAYSAAKHGVFGYFDALRTEVSHEGIDVHVIAPGSVRTNLARNALTGTGTQYGKTDAAIENGYAPSELVDKILAALAKGRKEIIIARGREKLGVTLRRFLPEQSFKVVAKVTPGIIKSIANAPSDTS